MIILDKLQHFCHKPLAFIKRDFMVAASYRTQFVMQIFGVFFSMTSFFMLSRMIGDASLPSLANYSGDYFAFMIVGIAFTDYFTISSDSFSSDIRSGQILGTLESLLVSPTSILTILLSSFVYKLLNTSIRIAIYFILGIFVFKINFHLANLPTLLLTFVLTILPFIGIGLISAAFIIVLKQGSPITSIIAISSSLLGGVMYPVAVLPEWLQPISTLLPITHGLEAMRQILLNGLGFNDIIPQLIPLVIFTISFLTIGIVAIKVAIKIAKKEGSLLHY